MKKKKNLTITIPNACAHKPYALRNVFFRSAAAVGGEGVRQWYTRNKLTPGKWGPGKRVSHADRSDNNITKRAVSTGYTAVNRLERPVYTHE